MDYFEPEAAIGGGHIRFHGEDSVNEGDDHRAQRRSGLVQL
ncbi:hypothetical protein [Streptomyces sp. NPDC051657]